MRSILITCAVSNERARGRKRDREENKPHTFVCMQIQLIPNNKIKLKFQSNMSHANDFKEDAFDSQCFSTQHIHTETNEGKKCTAFF